MMKTQSPRRYTVTVNVTTSLYGRSTMTELVTAESTGEAARTAMKRLRKQGHNVTGIAGCR